jgi:nicotinamide mononucleotide transporter
MSLLVLSLFFVFILYTNSNKMTFLNYIIENWIELLGATISFIYIYFSIRQKIGLWILGFLSSALYVVVFFQSKLYADMTLQFYYLGVSIYGWIHWRKQVNEEGVGLKIQLLKKSQILRLASGTLFIFVSYYWVLIRYTDSQVPVGDSFITALSIVGTWMLAKKLLENWLIWIVANGLSIVLFLYKGLYPTVLLSMVYTVMSVIGYWEWRKKSSINSNSKMGQD